MTNQPSNTDEQPQSDGKPGKAQGGADASGAGNILAGVQPGKDDGAKERRDD